MRKNNQLSTKTFMGLRLKAGKQGTQGVMRVENLDNIFLRKILLPQICLTYFS